MQIQSVIIYKKFITPDIFIIRLKRAESDKFDFLPGQYIALEIPGFKSDKKHYFSIASDPNHEDYIELCIRIYGDWTKHLSAKIEGDTVEISGPFGEFIWKQNVKYPVFLVGGVGISPVMSMLLYIAHKKIDAKCILLYGNRTPETVIYKEELYNVQELIDLEIVNIYSHLLPQVQVDGYKGFVTKDILAKEVYFDKKPTFFITGPPIFIEKMQDILKNEFNVGSRDINFEQIS
jgi:glycine betaine catabolism B